jgi:hypothetical protein
MVPWQYGHLLKQIHDAVDIPILTGEDIYLKEDLQKLIDMEAVDMSPPDLASSGGLIETKKIGDYAHEHGVAMAMHFAGSPVCFMANVHTAAASENFIALEHHSLDVPWWETLATKVDGTPFVDHGFAHVPDSPGLGVELNEEVAASTCGRGRASSTPRLSGTRSAATIGSGAEPQENSHHSAGPGRPLDGGGRVSDGSDGAPGLGGEAASLAVGAPAVAAPESSSRAASRSAATDRFSTRSFRSTPSTCFSTVRELIAKISPISRLVLPCASQNATSASLGLSARPAGSGTRVCGDASPVTLSAFRNARSRCGCNRFPISRSSSVKGRRSRRYEKAAARVGVTLTGTVTVCVPISLYST